MKYLFVFSFVLSGIFSVLASEGTIELEIQNAVEEEFTVYIPVKGNFFEGSQLKIRTDDEGRVVIKFALESPGICYLFFHESISFSLWNVFQLYIEPGSRVILNFDRNQPGQSTILGGDHLVENRFLSERKRKNLMGNLSQGELEYFISSNDGEGWYQKLVSLREMELLEIGMLESTGAVGKNFSDIATAEIHYYYASLIHEILSRTSLYRKSADSELNAMVSIMIENEIHGSDQYKKGASSCLWYIHYLRQRMIYYTVMNQKELALHYRAYENYTEAYWNLIYEFLEGPDFELFIAHKIVEMVREKLDETDIIQLFKRFSIEFPKSNYLPRLNKLTNSVLD